MINRVKGNLSVAKSFSCSQCGKEKIGQAFHFSIDAWATDEFMMMLKSRIDTNVLSFPVGWARSYPDKLHCENCK